MKMAALLQVPSRIPDQKAMICSLVKTRRRASLLMATLKAFEMGSLPVDEHLDATMIRLAALRWDPDLIFP